jgi:hypothetical protein
MTNVPALRKRHPEIARGPNLRSAVVALILMCLMVQSVGCSPQASGDGSSARIAPVRHQSSPDATATAQRESQPSAASPDLTATAAPPSVNAHDAAVRNMAARELDQQAAATMPALPPTPVPQPADPGAAAMIDSMNRALVQREASPEGVTLISVRELRNLSHASDSEFIRMRRHLCDALTRAGAGSKMVFVDGENPAIATHYRLLGSAYLVTAEGFDQWEMYLSLTPAARDFQVWDARSPVRMLRLPRPGQQEITFTPR